MKLFFCDICNESIPLQDIKENRATTIKGKIFCRKCNPLNELGDAATSPAPAAPGVGRWIVPAGILLLLLAAVGVGAWALWPRVPPESDGDAAARASAALQASVDDLRGSVRVLQSAFADVDRLRGVPNDVDALRDEIQALRQDVSRLERDLRSVQEGLVAVGSLRERVEASGLRLEETGRKLARLEERVEGLRRDVDELRQRPPIQIAPAGSAEAAGEAEGGQPAAAADPELADALERLKSEDSMARWEAVDTLRRRHDKALAPYVLPMLDDPDTFVRAQAIYTLGELKAKEAVPKLIDLLEDDEVMIREEALTSLVAITGQNFKFDVDGPRPQRQAGVRKWKEWYARNKDEF